jgi:hypothetical protein
MATCFVAAKRVVRDLFEHPGTHMFHAQPHPFQTHGDGATDLSTAYVTMSPANSPCSRQWASMRQKGTPLSG